MGKIKELDSSKNLKPLARNVNKKDADKTYLFDSNRNIGSFPRLFTKTIEEESTNNNVVKVASFMTDLSESAISNYILNNSEAIMTAFGVSKEDSAVNIGTAIYDKLQGGETISVMLDDGGILKISGHFDEGGTDYWTFNITYIIPEAGTNKCFEAGSGLMVKSGEVNLIANPAEITDTMDYDVALCIYSYKVNLTNVVISGDEEEFTLNIKGLTKKEDYDKPCIIDPNGADFTISLHDFKLPEEDAEGTVEVDGEAVSWKEIRKEIK